MQSLGPFVQLFLFGLYLPSVVNYREHVETLESRLDGAVSAIEVSQKALEKMSEYSEHIAKMIEPLEPVLNKITTQTALLDAHLKALGELRDKAIEAFPVIEQNLEKVTSQFASNIDKAISKSDEMLAHQKDSFEALQQGHSDLLENANKVRDTFSAELKSALDEMNKQMAQEFEKHGELIEKSAKSAKAAIDESWNESVKKLGAQFEQFDAQMQEQLKSSLELLGKNLASLSEKFVDDYTPLTQRLQEVVKIAEKIDRNE